MFFRKWPRRAHNGAHGSGDARAPAVCVGMAAVNIRADALAMNVAVARCNASSNLQNALAQRAALAK